MHLNKIKGEPSEFYFFADPACEGLTNTEMAYSAKCLILSC